MRSQALPKQSDTNNEESFVTVSKAASRDKQRNWRTGGAATESAEKMHILTALCNGWYLPGSYHLTGFQWEQMNLLFMQV